MARDRSTARRVLRTVLFTDIVRSTERLTEVGDAGWRALVQRHHAAVRTQIRLHRGREVDTAGDGFLITFEQPLDAVLCAMGIVRSVQALGLDSRAGIHTGEVERIGPKVGGIAVHTAARIMALAEPGEILVSSTVQDLVAGAGTEFVDRGVHELRGVPGERRLLAVVVPLATEAAEAGTVAVEAEVRRPWWRSRALAAAAGLAVLAVAGAVIAAMMLGGRSGAIPNGPDTVVALARDTGLQTAGVRVGRGPAAMSLGGATLWVASVEGATVSRVDTATGDEQAIGNVGSRPGAIAADGDSVWVADAFADRVLELAAQTGAALGEVDGVHGSALAIAFDSLWLADDVGDRIVRVDPATHAGVDQIALAAASGPVALATGQDRVWAGLRRSGEVVAIDPAQDKLVGGAIPFTDVAALAVTPDSVWAISPGEDELVRIDPVAMRVTQTIDVCDNPVALAVADDGVWIACSVAGRVWHVSVDGEKLADIAMNGLPTAVVVDGPRVWVALRGD